MNPENMDRILFIIISVHLKADPKYQSFYAKAVLRNVL